MANSEIDKIMVSAIDKVHPDRGAGRWCDECDQHGSHHTDRHESLATFIREYYANLLVVDNSK